MKKKISERIDKLLEEESLESVIETRFGKYSKYIIQDRALPDVRDGLKPVQRRILYAMWMLNLKPNKSYKKSARVVGDVIGKYHPHGDTSAYAAMIRLAQPWKTSVNLVEVHGNKGSIDGDPPAAMRYTEARLAPIATYMLEDINFNTVPFVLNFDDTELEPTVLPSYLPNFLINGAKGIASGYATETPPHNLGEVIEATKELIYNPNLETQELMKIIKGPDFPTYGTIYGIEEIYRAYETGKGKLLTRATILEKKNNKGKYLQVTDIPFDVDKPGILKKIEEFILDKSIQGIKTARDESDSKGISIIIELEPSVESAEPIIKFLYKFTNLQAYYNVNMVGIADRKPQILTLIEVLKNHIDHVKGFYY